MKYFLDKSLWQSLNIRFVIFMLCREMGPFLGTLFRNFTHIAEMPQWFPALLPAESKRDSPMREIVGAMVRGPMKRMKRPMRPEKPTSTWKTDPTIMDP